MNLLGQVRQPSVPVQ